MGLHTLVKLREVLNSVYNTEPLTNEINHLSTRLCELNSTVSESDYNAEINNLNLDLVRLNSAVNINRSKYAALIDHINQDIAAESSKFFTDNYKLELKYNAIENIRNIRVMKISDEVHGEVLSKIRLYTSWKYPALEIGCRDGEWTQHMVAADPLYIVDHYREFTESATRNFTEEYRRRIRVYLTQGCDMSALPQNQMGFVFCWNFLNYCSLDTIKEYLKEVKNLLRPGGIFLFSYNDGDRSGGAGMAENFFMSYMPKSMLIPLCESLGYEIVTDEARDMSISWLEIRKPGTLETVKAHQVMGEIKNINN
jgi:SAM-dependent methyltransferase